MKWEVVKNPGQDFVHIIPVGDLEPHDETANCRCEPLRSIVKDGCRDLLIHQVYDIENDNGISGSILVEANSTARQLSK